MRPDFYSPNTLAGIPAEIRLKIYDFLLVDQNVTHLNHDGTLAPRYATGLFTVNRQISEESLAYFHIQNAFVLVENHEAYFLSTCRRAIPLVLAPPTHIFRNYVLKAQIQCLNSRSAKKAYECGRAIFASRHLRNFVRLLNAEHAILRNTDNTTKVDLWFRTQRRDYKGNSRVLDCVTNGIRGMRPIQNPHGSRLTIKIHGDLDAQTAREIEMTKTPSYNGTTALEEGKLAKERGNAFFKAGDFNSARGEYVVAVYTFSSFKEDYIHDPRLMDEFETLLINISTNTSLADTKQGRHKSAVSQARKALEISLTRCVEESPEQKAKHRFRLGCALADNCQDGEAVDELEIAAAYAPGNTAIRAKLRQVKSRLGRNQKRSASKFRSNLSRAFV